MVHSESVAVCFSVASSSSEVSIPSSVCCGQGCGVNLVLCGVLFFSGSHLLFAIGCRSWSIKGRMGEVVPVVWSDVVVSGGGRGLWIFCMISSVQASIVGCFTFFPNLRLRCFFAMRVVALSRSVWFNFSSAAWLICIWSIRCSWMVFWMRFPASDIITVIILEVCAEGIGWGVSCSPCLWGIWLSRGSRSNFVCGGVAGSLWICPSTDLWSRGCWILVFHQADFLFFPEFW